MNKIGKYTDGIIITLVSSVLISIFAYINKKIFDCFSFDNMNKLFQSYFFWVVEILSIILISLIFIYLYMKKNREIKKKECEIKKITQEYIKFQKILDEHKSKRINIRENHKLCIDNLIGIVQSLVFDNSNMSEENILAPFLDHIAEKGYKVTIVRPNEYGGYDFLGQRGVRHKTYKEIKRRACWKVGEENGYYHLVFQRPVNIPYLQVKEPPKTEISVSRENDETPSKTHFIIGLKSDEYIKQNLPGGCLAVIAIGIPEYLCFENTDENNKKFYNEILCYLKSEEIILLIKEYIQNHNRL